MAAKFKDSFRQDRRLERPRLGHRGRSRRRVFFVQDRFELRSRLQATGDMPLQVVQDDFGLFVRPVSILKIGERPDFDRSYLERIQHAHRHGIGPLVGKMPPYPGPNLFVRLADVDRFVVVIVECIASPPIVPDFHCPTGAVLERCIEIHREFWTVGRGFRKAAASASSRSSVLNSCEAGELSSICTERAFVDFASRHCPASRRRYRQRLQQMPREKSHDRHRDAVTSDMIGIVVVQRQLVTVRKSHQSCRFPCRQETRLYRLPINHDDSLVKLLLPLP